MSSTGYHLRWLKEDELPRAYEFLEAQNGIVHYPEQAKVIERLHANPQTVAALYQMVADEWHLAGIAIIYPLTEITRQRFETGSRSTAATLTGADLEPEWDSASGAWLDCLSADTLELRDKLIAYIARFVAWHHVDLYMRRSTTGTLEFASEMQLKQVPAETGVWRMRAADGVLPVS